MKPQRRNQRLTVLAVGLVALVGALALASIGLKDSISYFYAPTELVSSPPDPGKKIRLGGMVLAGSIERLDGYKVVFTVSDYENSVVVNFDGILPDLFREGQGVVAEGVLNDNGQFIASRVLAKHDEKYMPPEVADSLKK